jgi:hypothetical protein
LERIGKAELGSPPNRPPNKALSSPQNKTPTKVIIHEDKRFPDSHWKATAQLEYVFPDPDDHNLHGDIYCVTVRFSWGTDDPTYEYFLTCGDPDIWEEEVVNEALGQLQNWAVKVCELLDRPPDLWPIGD